VPEGEAAALGVKRDESGAGRRVEQRDRTLARRLEGREGAGSLELVVEDRDLDVLVCWLRGPPSSMPTSHQAMRSRKDRAIGGLSPDAVLAAHRTRPGL
jgi:hypothetical protein